MSFFLLLSVAVIASCGLVYELMAATLSSYLLGDSITHFSLVIGLYLSSMGIGSYLTRFMGQRTIEKFLTIEILVGLLGGLSASALFVLFYFAPLFHVMLFGAVVLIGILVGAEIPLVMRILKEKLEFNDLVTRVFSLDYIGALLASVLFPIVMVPYLGLMRTGFLVGMINVGVGIAGYFVFRRHVFLPRRILRFAVFSFAVLIAGFVFSEQLQKGIESRSFAGTIIHSQSTPYQRILVTENRNDIQLYLNGNLQFSSSDEHRYHEALVHPTMATALATALETALAKGGEKPQQAEPPFRALVMGGGDGLALRELLKYKQMESVTLVELDPSVVYLFREHPKLKALNKESFANPKVKVVNQDAFLWVTEQTERPFDGIFIDFPDPSTFSLGKLYSETFYRRVAPLLSETGVGVVQSTSSYFAPESFWTIEKTLSESGFYTKPYHLYVPSFGDWGFVMFSKQPFSDQRDWLKEGLRFIDEPTFQTMLHFPLDMLKKVTVKNTLNDQVLVRTFEREWSALR